MSNQLIQANVASDNKIKPTLRDNLNSLMEECKISLSELHRNTGVPIATIQRIKNDQDSNPTISTLKPIADFFCISVSQLIGDDPLPAQRASGVYIENREHWIKIPIISWEQAITWPSINTFDLKLSTTSTDIDVGGNTFALKIVDDDWVGFSKGAIIIIDPNLNPKNRDYILVHKNGMETAIIKTYLIYEDAPYLIPLNSNFKTVPLDEEYRILGVIVQIRMDTRKCKA